jgi:hypothetical protein
LAKEYEEKKEAAEKVRSLAFGCGCQPFLIVLSFSVSLSLLPLSLFDRQAEDEFLRTFEKKKHILKEKKQLKEQKEEAERFEDLINDAVRFCSPSFSFYLILLSLPNFSSSCCFFSFLVAVYRKS